MRIIQSSGAIVGREKTIASPQAELHPKEWFWSREEVESFLRGEIESEFVSKTLPVEVAQNGTEYCLQFYGRIAGNPQVGNAE